MPLLPGGEMDYRIPEQNKVLQRSAIAEQGPCKQIMRERTREKQRAIDCWVALQTFQTSDQSDEETCPDLQKEQRQKE